MTNVHKGHTYEIAPKNGVRKYPTTALLAHVPYANHCIHAAHKAMEHGGPTDLVITALYHDAEEDQRERWDKWGSAIAGPAISEHVHHVSERDGENREQYMERLKYLPDIPKRVKIYDRYDNLIRGFVMLRSSYLRRTITENEDVYLPALDAMDFPAQFKERFRHMHDNLILLADKVEQVEAETEQEKAKKKK